MACGKQHPAIDGLVVSRGWAASVMPGHEGWLNVGILPFLGDCSRCGLDIVCEMMRQAELGLAVQLL